MESFYVDAIKQLVSAYYQGSLSPEEYRAKRRLLIEQMDKEFNGSSPALSDVEHQTSP